jgi:hypothetical protein
MKLEPQRVVSPAHQAIARMRKFKHREDHKGKARRDIGTKARRG